jgi:hypothetical protein
MDNYFEKEKNNNRLDVLAATECSKRCLANFKTDRLSTNENICLTSCLNRYYDALVIGDDVFSNSLTNNRLNNLHH